MGDDWLSESYFSSLNVLRILYEGLNQNSQIDGLFNQRGVSIVEDGSASIDAMNDPKVVDTFAQRLVIVSNR